MARTQSIEELMDEALEDQEYIDEHSDVAEVDESWKNDLEIYNEREANKLFEEEHRREMLESYAMDCLRDIEDMDLDY